MTIARTSLLLGLLALCACAFGADPDDEVVFGPTPRLDGGGLPGTGGDGKEDHDDTESDDAGSDGSDDGLDESTDDGAGDDESDTTTGAPPPGMPVPDPGEEPPNPMCSPDPGDGQCRACGRAHCCEELLDCESDGSCACALDCVEQGGQPDACWEECGDSVPALLLAVCGLTPCGDVCY